MMKIKTKKFRYIVVILLIFFSKLLIAQDKKEVAFEKAIDYCECMITYKYVSLYAEKTDATENEKEIFTNFNKGEICKNNPIPNLKSLIVDTDGKGFPRGLPKIVKITNDIKKNVEHIDQSRDDIILLIFNKYLNPKTENLFSLFFNANNRRKPVKNQILNTLKKDSFLNDILKDFEIKTTSIPTKNNDSIINLINDKLYTLEKSIKELGKKQQNMESCNQIFFFTTLIFLLTSFILSFLLYRMRKKIKNKKTSLSKLTTNQLSEEEINLKLEERISMITEKKLLDLEEKLKNIIETKKSVKTEHDYNNEVKDSDSPKKTIRDNETKTDSFNTSINVSQDILYAPSPNKDGSFDASVVVETENPSKSFYKLYLFENSKTAKFEFLNTERAVRVAASSYEMIIKPLCKVKGSINSNAKKIYTSEKGILIKRGDNWVLDKKAEIKYE
ncbi:hypothetical protein [uncultured Kordia sp.]|uniref:hypothetical protein n=1 Tax=uncultured Kordia sp. TaxID=507699 RepID=UPI0026206FCA|nr:hypothetical protein [uncultured Kordia sp.]